MEKSFHASEFPWSVYILLIVEHACLISLCHIETFLMFIMSNQHDTAKLARRQTFSRRHQMSQNLDVIQAETLFTNFLVEHNIALSAADSAGNFFFLCMFLNCTTAKQYGCGRTKTSAIVKCDCSRYWLVS